MSFRKGFIGDVPFWIVAVFGMGVSLLIIVTIFSNIDTQMAGIGGEGYNIFHTMNTGVITLLDGLFVFVFFGLGLVSIYFAAQTRTTPIMLAAGIFVLIVSLILAPIISNVYNSMATATGISTTGHSSVDAFFEGFGIIVLLFGAAILMVSGFGGGGNA